MLLLKLAPLKSASLKSEPIKSVKLKSTPLKFAAIRKAPLKFIPLKYLFLRSAPIRFRVLPNAFLPFIVFFPLLTFFLKNSLVCKSKALTPTLIDVKSKFMIDFASKCVKFSISSIFIINLSLLILLLFCNLTASLRYQSISCSCFIIIKTSNISFEYSGFSFQSCPQ